MTTTFSDGNVEDFLDRVKELDERRKFEDEQRRRKLQEEVALKKKKYGSNSIKTPPTRQLQRTITDSDGEFEATEIRIAHPVARVKSPDDSVKPLVSKPSPPSHKLSHKSHENSPHLYKYEDTSDVDKTLLRFKSKRRIPAPLKSPIPQDSLIISLDSSDDEAEQQKPPLPARKEEPAPELPTRRQTKEEKAPPLPSRKKQVIEEEEPPKLPLRKESVAPIVPKKKISYFDSLSQKSPESKGVYIPRPNPLAVVSATAAAKAPQLMKNSVDSSVGSDSYLQKSPESSKGMYIPRPNSIAVMSATAAAKAPQLMKNTVDSSLGERSPDLQERAKFLTNLGNGKSNTPKKTSSEVDNSTVNSPSRSTNRPLPHKGSWLDSALNHSSTTKQMLSSSESSIKMKPLVPNKPNSLATTSAKLQDHEDKMKEIRKTMDTLSLRPVSSNKSDKSDELDSSFSVAELRLSSDRKPLPIDKEKLEALTRAKHLKPMVPKRKVSDKQPEALETISKLKSSAPIIKLKPEKPEALRQATKLKPTVPLKKDEVENFELLNKLSSLRKNETSPMRVNLPKRNFEQNNLNLLKKSMDELKKSQNGNPPIIKPLSNDSPIPGLRRTHTETMTMVRTPFMDPNAPLPVLARPKTFDSSELTESKKLNHLTKTRSRGPKRRLPKTIDNDEPKRVEDFKITVRKNPPPPIKSSSRVVSNKLEKRVFSNSELFI